ncbi:MAG: type II/IV secretion system protein [Proteobacteria bacterium]|nr:type II/IV secretion system protein [Pseudomonadota bacterium]
MARDPRSESFTEQGSGEIVRALDDVIRRATKLRASDIHFEPKPDKLRIRFRVDGVMVEQPYLPLKACKPMISRIKVLGRMDIAIKRQPQDGTFKVDLGHKKTVSLRASTFPCFDGEKAVLRLLEADAVIGMDQLGMGRGQVQALRRLVRNSGGLVLVTGPTGSGKTSTLYSVLSELDTTRLNIVTLEDPIEVQITEITQGQVNPRAGFTFADGLRAILRQDPDVILVGEMRDAETASIAIQASLTGHLVLSTMHTNSTISTITRLMDLGIEPYIVANALVGVVAQRLVRVVCSRCNEPYTLEKDVSEEVGFALPENATLVRAVGCDHCMFTGFKGRRGIFEVVEVEERLQALIKTRGGSDQYKKLLRDMTVPTLRRVGMRQALKGRTTASEILRVT